MRESAEEPRQPRHYSAEEFLLISNLDPGKSRDFLEKEGIVPGSGDVKIWIDGQERFISTDEEDFGTLITKT